MTMDASGDDSFVSRLLLAPWRTERGAIRTRLSTAQCRERLAGAVDPWWKFFGDRPVLGWTGGAGGTLRKRIGYNNSWQTVLRYRLESSGAGTRIEYTAGMSRYARVFSLVWLGMVTLFGVFGTAAAFRTSTPGAWMFVIVPLLMATFMVALTAFCRWLARDELARLIDVLSGAVEGESSNY